MLWYDPLGVRPVKIVTTSLNIGRCVWGCFREGGLGVFQGGGLSAIFCELDFALQRNLFLQGNLYWNLALP